ncbi:MAG TPA: hypothetical protein VNJ52_04675 [Patescibacteria group bacterium]|nr:hypothetical protein [Patescibacteria group bacterium]
MKGKIISLLAVVVMSAGVALSASQPGRTADQMAGGQMGGQGQMGGRMGHRQGKMNVDQRVARMKSELNLTDKQAAAVKDLFENQQRDRESWRKSHAQASKEEMQEHRRQMFTTMNDGLKKILTPEQFKKHEAMMHRQMRRSMRNRSQTPPQN